MAHLRNRHLFKILTQSMQLNPIVGIIGHRQVGKTTLLEACCQDYYSLDRPSEAQELQQDVALYLKKRSTLRTALDEVQSQPTLFPELKEVVRKRKTPGQYLLSGSVRFTSKASIRESLTGRLSTHELYPFTISELMEKELPSVIYHMMETKSFKQPHMDSYWLSVHETQKRKKVLEKYLQNGGLPGLCFLRNEKEQIQKAENQLQTILDRDLRSLIKSPLLFSDIRTLLIELGNLQGQSIDYTALKKASNLSTPTIKRLIYIFESLFLIRVLPIEGQRKGHTLFFEDLLEWKILTGSSQTTLEHFLFREIYSQLHYHPGRHIETFQYKSRNGSTIPFCFRSKEGILGILAYEKEGQFRKHLGSANSFLKAYSNSKVLFLTDNEKIKPRIVHDRLMIMPVEWVI